MSVYRELGLQPIINASGSVTRLGGAPMPQEVLQAFEQAARETVPLEQLQAAASRKIASHTGAEAGIVTSGSAAALTLGAAAILSGYDLGRMEQLPHCEGFPHHLLIAREHRSGYDHAVRASGARFIEVGFNEQIAGAGVRRVETWEYEAAIDERVTGIFYVYIDDSHPPLEAVVEVAHRHSLPVLVDAAGELPPRSNLRDLLATGADLVAFSGGKAIRGPQATGLLVGRRDLIGSAVLQMLDMDDHYELWEPPVELIDKQRLGGIPRHGVGRSLKVAKEQIVALLKALDLFAEHAYAADMERANACFEAIRNGLVQAPVECEIREVAGERQPPMRVRLLSQAPIGAFELCRRLRRGSPPIFLGHGELDQGVLSIQPLCLNVAQAQTIAARICEELGSEV